MKLTDEAKQQVLGALRVGATMEVAAVVVHVTRRALYKLMDRDEEFKEAANEARGYADGKVIRAMYRDAITPGASYQRCREFWLKNRQPDKWRDRHEHEITGADGGPQRFIVTAPGVGIVPPATAPVPDAGATEHGEG